VEEDVFVFGVGDLFTALQPSHCLSHVFRLQGRRVTPLLTHVQRFLYDLPGEYLGDTRHSDDDVLRDGRPCDGLDQPLDGSFREGRASIHFISVELLLREGRHQNLHLLDLVLIHLVFFLFLLLWFHFEFLISWLS